MGRRRGTRADSVICWPLERFLRVDIENFRSIEHLVLDLTDGAPDKPLPVAVLVGPNGAGKTAALEACVRLSFPFALQDALAVSLRPFANEIRDDGSTAKLTASVLPTRGESAFLRNALAPSGILDIELEIAGTDAQVHLRKPQTYTNQTPASIVYFDAARSSPRGRVAFVTPTQATQLAEHAAAPSIESRRHQWTKQQIVNLRFAQMLAREGGRTETSFDRLWEPVHGMLERIRFREITRDLRILFDTPSGAVEFDDLSSGEQSVILMFTDLLVRDLSEATVLIDEVELHLHPNWQAKILGALRTLLPDCQFIVTTQSPIVAASVKESKYLFTLGDIA